MSAEPVALAVSWAEYQAARPPLNAERLAEIQKHHIHELKEHHKRRIPAEANRLAAEGISREEATAKVGTVFEKVNAFLKALPPPFSSHLHPNTADHYLDVAYAKRTRPPVEQPVEEEETVQPQDTPPAAFTFATPPSSFVSRYIRYASERTDAPLEAHEVAAVGILSALAGPGARMPLATSPRGTSLGIWTMYTVDSTEGRKTVVLNIAADFIEGVLGKDAVLSWEGSPQGFIQRLQERDGKAAVFLRDEYSGLLQQMNRGGHMSGLEQTFIRAFDNLTLENVRTSKRNKATGERERDVDRVDNPYLVKVTCSTWTSLMTRATIDNVLNGFLARFAFVTGKATPRAVRRTTDWMTRERDDLMAYLRAFHERVREVETVYPTDEVLKAFWELQVRWKALAQDHPQPDAASPSMQRLAEAVLKTAALLALDRDKEPVTISEPEEIATRKRVDIKAEDFEAAVAIGERWKVGTLAVVEGLGATVFQRNCDRVAALIARSPDLGVSHRKVSRAFRGLDSKALGTILRSLYDQGRIHAVEQQSGTKGGRPSVTWFPVLTRKQREQQEAGK